MQSDLFEDNPEVNAIELDMPDASVRYLSNFLTTSDAEYYFEILQRTLAWRQDHIKMFGKSVKIPRLQAWYGEPVAAYTYSGLTMQPLAWTTELAELRHRCEEYCRARFNSVLANYYRDGQDSMGAHSDNEPELGAQPIIASLSLGQERELIFKHQYQEHKLNLPLANGSLLIMSGTTQDFWLHNINKRTIPLGPRINLTFRMIYPLEK